MIVDVLSCPPGAATFLTQCDDSNGHCGLLNVLHPFITAWIPAADATITRWEWRAPLTSGSCVQDSFANSSWNDFVCCGGRMTPLLSWYVVVIHTFMSIDFRRTTLQLLESLTSSCRWGVQIHYWHLRSASWFYFRVSWLENCIKVKSLYLLGAISLNSCLVEV